MPSLIIKQDTTVPWWSNPNVWDVDQGNPSGLQSSVVNSPVANSLYWLKTVVTNTTSVQADGTVYFYWSTPAVGFTPNQASGAGHQVGTPVAVGVIGGSERVKLSTVEWTAPLLTDAHACIMAAVVEAGVDVLTLGTGATDQRVGQHNLTILPVTPSMSFHFPFEVFNPMTEGKAHEFTIEAKQADLEEVERVVKSLGSNTRIGGIEGQVKQVGFAPYSPCPPQPDEFKKAKPLIEKLILERNRSTGYSLVGTFEGDAALIDVTQHHDRRVVSGLSVLLIRQRDGYRE